MLALPGEELQIMKKSFSPKCPFAGPQREQNYINISFHIISIEKKQKIRENDAFHYKNKTQRR
jgi:hypothetical protein